MKTSLGQWIKQQKWFSQYTTSGVPSGLDVCDVFLQEEVPKIPIPTKAKLFHFVAANGPLPLGVMSIKDPSGRFNSTKMFDYRCPSSLETTLKRLQALSSEPEAPRYVYNHRFIPGHVIAKTVEFYRNWAVSSKYTPGLSYLIFSNYHTMIDAALSFHEQNCWLCITNPLTFIHIGALRLRLAMELGGGDATRRVNDLRALSLIAAGNDFKTNIGGTGLKQLIDVYRCVTKENGGYLVDGERWNLDVLKQLLKRLGGKPSKKLDETLCKRFFKYMAWALQLFNGFCPDFDFLPPSSPVNPADLLATIRLFDESVLFEDETEILRSLPGAILRLCQEQLPHDAPQVLEHEGDVFAPMIRQYGSSWEVARTIADVLEQYRDFAGQVPDLDDNRYWAPVMCRRGERSIVPLVKSDPDFGSVFRVLPVIGEVVLVRVGDQMVVGLVREIIDKERCRVQLYHITLPAVSVAVPVDDQQVKALKLALSQTMRATYVGHIECEVSDLLWKGNPWPDPKKATQKPGRWCIVVEGFCFGFVGVVGSVSAKKKSVMLIGNESQTLSQVPDVFSQGSLRPFNQLSCKKIEKVVKQGHI